MNRQRPSLTSLVAFAMLLTVLYVLSYAPVYRWTYGASVVERIPITCGNAISFDASGRPVTFWEASMRWKPIGAYRPVELLIDRTPLRGPLLSWSGLFGVREDFEFGSQFREARRLLLESKPTTA
jgi:hypothetical protein